MAQKTIYLKTTGSCNLNCKHCFSGGKNGDKTQFDPVVTAKWVNEFIQKYPTSDHHIEFHGGEPFLVPVNQLILFADHFKDLPNVTMCANSNLTFKLNDDLVEFIKNYLGSNIGTSWDHWIRFGNEKQLNLWKSNVKKLKAEGVYIHLKVSISKELLEMTADWFLDQIESFGVDEIALERITLSGNASDNLNIFPDNEKQDNWYLSLYKRYKERNLNFNIKTLDVIEEKLKMGLVKVDTNCRNCEQNLVTINSNGTLGGCPNVASEHKHSTITKSVEEFLVSDGRVDEIVKELDFNLNCVHCDVFDLCGGDCHRLPWQGNRCGGLKNTLRYLTGRVKESNLILKV